MIKQSMHSLGQSLWQISLVSRRECLLKQRKPADWLNPLLFFILIMTLFPLATTAQPTILPVIAPGVIWVSVVLSMLLSMPSLFQYDYVDGCLEQYLLNSQPLTVLVCAKIVVHWLFIMLPIVCIAPVLGLMYGLNAAAVWILLITLLLATPTLMLLAALTAALTTCLPHAGFLLALILLPMCLPVIIFASSAVGAAAIGMPIAMQLATLMALLLLAITAVPLVIASSLRIGMGFY